MEDERGGVEERKADETKQGGEGAGMQAGAGAESRKFRVLPGHKLLY